MTKKKFYFSAVKQYSNAGDALINHQLIELMRRHGSVCAFRGNAPLDFVKEIGLLKEEIFNYGMIRMLASAVKDRLVGKEVFFVQAPGDMSSAPVNMNSVFRSAVVACFSFFGVRTIQVGASLGNLTANELLWLARKTKYMHYFGLRDSISLKKAETAKLKNFGYFPDLAFAATAKPTNVASSDEIRVALSFRSDQLDESEINIIIENLGKVMSTFDGKVKLKIVTQVEKDIIFSKKCKEILSSLNPDIVHSLKISNLEKIYSDVDIVFSNRLHVLLLSGVCGALPVGVVDNRFNSKIIGLFDEIRVGDLIYHDARLIDINALAKNRLSMRQHFLNAAKKENIEIHDKFKKVVELGNE